MGREDPVSQEQREPLRIEQLLDQRNSLHRAIPPREATELVEQHLASTEIEVKVISGLLVADYWELVREWKAKLPAESGFLAKFLDVSKGPRNEPQPRDTLEQELQRAWHPRHFAMVLHNALRETLGSAVNEWIIQGAEGERGSSVASAYGRLSQLLSVLALKSDSNIERGANPEDFVRGGIGTGLNFTWGPISLVPEKLQELLGRNPTEEELRLGVDLALAFASRCTFTDTDAIVHMNRVLSISEDAEVTGPGGIFGGGGFEMRQRGNRLQFDLSQSGFDSLSALFPLIPYRAGEFIGCPIRHVGSEKKDGANKATILRELNDWNRLLAEQFFVPRVLELWQKS